MRLLPLPEQCAMDGAQEEEANVEGDGVWANFPVGACALVGYGLSSWSVGIGLYFAFAITAEHLEDSIVGKVEERLKRFARADDGISDRGPAASET